MIGPLRIPSFLEGGCFHLCLVCAFKDYVECREVVSKDHLVHNSKFQKPLHSRSLALLLLAFLYTHSVERDLGFGHLQLPSGHDISTTQSPRSLVLRRICLHLSTHRKKRGFGAQKGRGRSRRHRTSYKFCT